MATFEIFSSAIATKVIVLPQPDVSKGLPFHKVLYHRRSVRSFSSEPISDQQIAELLWAASGVTQRTPLLGRTTMRTNPSAHNYQETELFLMLKSGVYLYDAENNRLDLVTEGDYRTEGGLQSFVQEAPLTICLVSNFNKMPKYISPKKRDFYAGIDVGYVSQNIYLYCASEGLATTACGLINRKRLAKVLHLQNAKVMITHPVGFPNKE